MKVIFYSDQCDYSIKLLAYLDKYNIKSLFKLVNVDKVIPPKEIDIVPTIIDTELNQPLKGKKAFEYLINIKYFNNPTNNIDDVKELPPNPAIPEDDKAIKSETINLKLDNQIDSLFKENESTTFYEESKNSNNILKISQNMTNQRQIQDSKLNILYKLKGKLK
jgi:hypothetical protein